jgi:hypothetical protein
MIAMEPALEALYYRHRPAEIYLRTHPHYADLHPFHPLLEKIVPGILTASQESAPGLPSDEKKPQGYDFFYNTTGCVEMNRGIHAIDSFALAMSAPVIRRTPILYLDPSIPVEPLDIVVHTPKRISVTGNQTPRNADFRNYDIPMLLETYLRKEGIEFNSITSIGQGMEVSNGLQSFARTIAGAKLFVGPDSAGAHIAAALSVPHVIAYTPEFPSTIRAYPNTIAVHDDDVELLLRTAAFTYKNLTEPKEVSLDAITRHLGKRFMFGKVNGPHPADLPGPSSGKPDCIMLYDLTVEEKWRDRLRDWVDRINEGGRIFLYEKHKKYGGFDAVLLAKFMIESLGLEVLEYTATADVWGGYYIAAAKHRKLKGMVSAV